MRSLLGTGSSGWASFFPRHYAAHEDERVESLFSQLQRHPGAGRFARSSAVEVDVLVLRENLEFFGKIVGFNEDGSSDALCVRVVVAVTANVEYQNPILFIGGQL